MAWEKKPYRGEASLASSWSSIFALSRTSRESWWGTYILATDSRTLQANRSVFFLPFRNSYPLWRHPSLYPRWSHSPSKRKLETLCMLSSISERYRRLKQGLGELKSDYSEKAVRGGDSKNNGVYVSVHLQGLGCMAWNLTKKLLS